MNQLAAMKVTLDLIRRRQDEAMDHFEDMYERASQGEFSEAKLGRWLGWIQGAASANGLMTLDEAKEINRRHSEEKG